jgi:NAD(P)-dependent dehydrogenase (short-subunit alcohol dehydrogenase family)
MTAANELVGRVAVVIGGSGGSGSPSSDRCERRSTGCLSNLVVPREETNSWLECDVRDDASVASAVREMDRRFGRLDIVVHAAGVSRDAVVWKLTAEDWDFMQAVNLRGAFLLIRHAVNAIEPGWVRTLLTERVPEQVREAARAESLLGTLLDPHDIAAAVRFLCGPGDRRITGQILRVDAGQYSGGS